MPEGPAPDCTEAARRPKAAPAADGYVYSLMPVLEGKWPTLVCNHLDIVIYLYVCAWHGAGGIIIFSLCYFTQPQVAGAVCKLHLSSACNLGMTLR